MKKVIVITGGNSGVGKAVASILVKKNTVVVLGKNISELNKTAKELGCDSYVCDVTNSMQIKKVLKKIVIKHKRVDCLINCAGVWIKGPIDENSPEDIKNTISVNSLGTMLTVNAFVPQFKKQKKGRILNVISQAGLYGRSERSVYNASKWAVTGFTKSIQIELAPHNIGVMGFYPGFIHTDIFKKAGDNKSDFSKAMDVLDVAKAICYLVNLEDDLIVRSFELESLKSI